LKASMYFSGDTGETTSLFGCLRVSNISDQYQ
jgi:hypothetical protein